MGVKLRRSSGFATSVKLALISTFVLNVTGNSLTRKVISLPLFPPDLGAAGVADLMAQDTTATKVITVTVITATVITVMVMAMATACLVTAVVAVLVFSGVAVSEWVKVPRRSLA
jgi:hypothetical protein